LAGHFRATRANAWPELRAQFWCSMTRPSSRTGEKTSACSIKAKDYGPLMLTVIYATEKGTPHGREKIDWKLLTDLPVRSRQDAIEKLRQGIDAAALAGDHSCRAARPT